MLNRFNRWLRAAPIRDMVDRRNAPVMQLLLLFYAVVLPLNWAWRFSVYEVSANGQRVVFVDLVIALLAWAGIVLIRRGRFRLAVVLFIAPQLVSLGITFALAGVESQLIDPTPTVLTLSLAGLVLGRRALWTVWALLMVDFAIGFNTGIARALAQGDTVQRALRDLPAVVITYLLVTIILDRTVAALRESLAESQQRSRELRRTMAERERAQAQLVHAQKMEVTGRLTSGIAHDFNHILSLILGFAGDRHRMDVAARERERLLEASLEGVEIAARRGEAISGKLLRFGRNDVTRPEDFDAGVALNELAPLLRQLFDTRVRLQLRPGSETLPVRLDRSQFELMVLNIASNARDAMPDGGDFSITAHAVHGSDGAQVRIELADTGHGMDRQVMAQLFEPFFSTKPPGSGTGLGLSVVRDLLDSVGGRIHVDSTPGGGSRFTIFLPLAHGAAADATAARTQGDGVST
ncbi:MAG: ATP-binding protein [Pseudoxanthomonas sp.]